ncbi:MAG: 16S rRNA (guanine(527)-N(7))-methyltransferase RsmG [Thermoleophilia bacterium]|nr:16S rRNA (guanine(527)-N(7))-methyltransferase RsmG [Thermoleophilia bacterium]
MELRATEEYRARGLGEQVISRLGLFGDMLLAVQANVSAIRDPAEIETLHFLDCLSLLELAEVRAARRIADVGSGGGLPAVVLALVLPEARVVAVESVRRKCDFVRGAARSLGLENLEVACVRAEDYGRSPARESFDAVVARAVASLPVLAELCVPLVRAGGVFVAMKGAMSDQERIPGRRALAILGAETLQESRARSFAGAENRWLYVAYKTRNTPDRYPRRAGMPVKRPLGSSAEPGSTGHGEQPPRPGKAIREATRQGGRRRGR